MFNYLRGIRKTYSKNVFFLLMNIFHCIIRNLNSSKEEKNYSVNGFANAISMNLNKSSDFLNYVLHLAQSEYV